MIFILIFSGFITISLESLISSSNPTSSYYSGYSSVEIEERVTGGSDVNQTVLEKFNYQVGIHIYTKNKTISSCGGVLIHFQIVLTAAHCVYNAFAVGIHMGTILKTEKIASPDNILVLFDNIRTYSDFKNTWYANDIAIIKLPVAMNEVKYIGTIALATESSNCDAGIAWVSGWGRTDDDVSSRPAEMHYAQVNPIKSDLCKAKYPGPYLCTNSSEGKTSCKGDSGGPYAFENENGERYLCGLNAANVVPNSKCTDNNIRLKTEISYYHANNWINIFVANSDK